MLRFFKEMEKGFGEALTKNVLWFTFGWTIGTLIKVIIESFTDSKAK